MKSIAKFAAITLAVFMTTQLAAQVRFNPKVGVNYSGFEGDIRDFQTSSRIGWNAGADLRVGRGALTFQPGLHYYQFTAALEKTSNLPDNLKLEDNTTIQAIKLPVNIGLRLTGEGGLMALHARGGIVPTYVVGVQEKADFDLSKDDLQAFSYGANVGLGVDLLIFTVDIGYEFGLSEFFKVNGEKQNVLTLSAGIRF